MSEINQTPIPVFVELSSGKETNRGPSLRDELSSGGVGSVGALAVVGLDKKQHKTLTTYIFNCNE